ncbi:MAG: hypothetical protein EPO11_02740 [Gammaproteobacteria bacterium]|nr:MAG: hypothetical protein EPO11_02740 [Gammaproteobacteria bacterium]
MEYSSKKIKNLIFKVIPLLKLGNENYWLNYFNYVLASFDNSNNEKEIIRSFSQIFKGGMGSFSDLVLHRNGIPLIEENNQLESLKDQLFDACEEYLRN